MEQKTKITAEDGKQYLVVTREFDLPLDLLFTAFAEAELIEQWMGAKVIKLDCKRHGSYQFETTDPKGYKHAFSGTIHDYVPNSKITRTFEMENTPFPVQLEFLEFEKLAADRSKLNMLIVYKSVEHRSKMLQLPFAQGINMAHNRIQEILQKSNEHI
jgi:uncharacterized protein YndB with AHSA1/START domain